MDELGDLAELRLLAVLATYRRDGTVLLSPVWHEWPSVATLVRTVSTQSLLLVRLWGVPVLQLAFGRAVTARSGPVSPGMAYSSRGPEGRTALSSPRRRRLRMKTLAARGRRISP
jgi:hypothetical protein